MSAGGDKRSISLNKIVIFGDSLTQKANEQDTGFGLVPALQDLYTRKFDVLTRGFMGYTSAHGRYMIDPILDAEHRPKDNCTVELLILFWGSNDSTLEEWPSHVPIPDYLDNMRYMIKAAQSRGISRIILVAPALYDEIKGYPDNSVMKFLEYGQALKTLTSEFDVGFIDLWHEFTDYLGWKEGDPVPGKLGDNSPIDLVNLLPDSIHFSGEAYRIYYNALIKVIDDKFPDIKSDNLTEIMPPWDSIPIKELPDCLWK
ncbi:Iah1p [Sugiyamaella lignohabitans]|uniref:Iah1p n=1 Tax=Sugiyamaella lignohabitans TaxID=796027 RepID=A0A167CC34_9ASCO|nr:Iah1p [Sugiyamaella lignohabitans]ANB11489.1 Iah1p [Sugiyamaella lignohabitans]